MPGPSPYHTESQGSPHPCSFLPAPGANMAPSAHPPFHVQIHPPAWLSLNRNS